MTAAYSAPTHLPPCKDILQLLNNYFTIQLIMCSATKDDCVHQPQSKSPLVEQVIYSEANNTSIPSKHKNGKPQTYLSRRRKWQLAFEY